MSDHESDYEVTERLCLTEDGRLVLEGDPDGRWLFAVPGDRLSPELAATYSRSAETSTSAEGEGEAGQAKQRRKSPNKARRAAENK